MICPQCGYERKKNDEIIRATECPKCGIIYSKWKNTPPPEDQQLPHETLEKPALAISGKTKTPVERLVIYAVIAVVLIAVIHAVVLPALIRLFQSGKNASEISEKADTSIDSSPPVSEELRTAKRSTEDTPEYTVTQKQLSIADIVRATRESVVVIKTATGVGSGFFINRDGNIVTNKHVLANAGRAEIKTVNGNTFRILQVVQEDSDADLVIASTDASPQESKPVKLSARLPETGEKVIVIGNPLGLEQTVSDGIVSAVRRNQRAVDFIQVTAPVSAGNSGGPLLNMSGEVVGVATFQYRAGQNLNFCVAASRIVDLQQGSNHYSARQAGSIETPTTRDVYCYADGNGQVSFVDWKTGMLVSRPDGSLDRVKFERWALDQIGGNPDAINPEKEARDDVERNREKLFKSVFPHRSMSDGNLTSAEKDWLETAL